MYNTILCVILLILLIGGLVIMFRRGYIDEEFEEEEIVETITTETTIEEGLGKPIVGKLAVRLSGKQCYVIDPADAEKVWLNSHDDMYEDADGKIWELV